MFNRITFSGTTEAGGFSQQAYKDRFTSSSVERLTPFAKLLNDEKITNMNYNKLIIKEEKDVFIFLDSPYFQPPNRLCTEKTANYTKGLTMKD